MDWPIKGLLAQQKSNNKKMRILYTFQDGIFVVEAEVKQLQAVVFKLKFVASLMGFFAQNLKADLALKQYF